MRPSYVLCLGSDAAKALLGKSHTVTSMKGRVEELGYQVNDDGDEPEYHTAKVMVVMHPGAVYRTPEKYDEFLDASTIGEVSRCHYFIVFGQMHEVLGSFEFGKLKLRDFLNFRDWCMERFSYYTAFMKVAKVKAFSLNPYPWSIREGIITSKSRPRLEK